ncbi:hypothetical protein SAMN04489761_4501 [Tenacibaculum sp. MAR_2009_124]|uniref:hypothetical protein n=1 Tax=Tenacibaculum sp. MAR_2009_124 TaxID=1250059 RepID=UPI000898EE2E|nr:hypothetical protein [Tenacibaculum sp. MAR_2009_124]SED17099.1 hypothetical protein SAMN04489761_4501 [Tenacibaculum sp. MAR_2009_124]
MNNSKKVLNFISLSVIAIFFLIHITSCSDSDGTITPTNNTQEYFKYTINGTERIFDVSMTAYRVINPNPNYQKFFFRAGATQPGGASIYVDGNFTFSDLSSFLATTNVPWGAPDPNTSVLGFYFAEHTAANKFFPTAFYATSPIDCTIVMNANNVGDYLEFTFSGTYTDAIDSSINGPITGSGRMKRGADQ